MAGDYDELKAVLTELLNNRFAPKPAYTRGLLGDGRGNVIVPSRPDKCYVRFNRGASEYFEVFNVTVNAVNDWPVLIGELPWQKGLTQVVGTDWAAYEQSGWGDNVGATSPHAPTHEWPDGSPGSDPVNVFLRSIVPLRAYSVGTGSTTIYVNSYEYENPNGSGTIWGGLPGLDLAPVMSSLTTGNARMMGIYLDPNVNTLGIVTGASDIFTAASDPPWPQFPRGVIPSARIRVYGGQASIGEADIRDARQPFAFIPTGTASATPSGAAGGDLTGSYPNPQVAGLFGSSLLNIAPAEGDILMFTGSAWQPVRYDDKLLVNNASGASAVTGDVGYLDEAGDYQTTTTANDLVSWVVVTKGGANGAEIEVVNEGVRIVNYTGTAPSERDFLTTSTVAGNARAVSAMNPAIFAICLADGIGGKVKVLLLINRVSITPDTSKNLINIATHSGTDFTATIAAKSGADVEYTVTGGTNENSIEPSAANQLGKIVLHNTSATGTTSALIDSVDTAGTATPADGTITLTATAPAEWAVSDNITTRSQTNTAQIGANLDYYFDIDLTAADNDAIPALATSIICEFIFTDTSAPTANTFMVVHPYITDSASKRQAMPALSSTAGLRRQVTIPLISRRFCLLCNASGAATASAQLNVIEVEVAAP